MSPATRSTLTLLALLLTSAGVLTLIQTEFNRVVTQPYMDEPFHIGQTQAYCAGNWTQWDAKITTLPGLYFSAIAMLSSVSHAATLLSHIAPTVAAAIAPAPAATAAAAASPFSVVPSPATLTPYCTLSLLRYVNVLYAIACVALFYALIPRFSNTRKPPATAAAKQQHHQQHQQQSSLLYRVLKTVELSVFPLHFFFCFLYYTDTAATCWVLLMLWAAQRKWNNMTALCGFIAILHRQTNVIWLLFTLATQLLHKYELGQLSASGNSNVSAQLLYPTQTKHVPAALLQFALSLLRNLAAVLQFSWAYLLCAALFAGFVVVNGGIVLGDRSNHIAIVHIPQLYYFLLSVALFSAPSMLQPAVVLRTVRDMCGTFKRLLATLVIAAVMALTIQRFTYAHPFLLSDNRHYTFYLWQRLLVRHALCKYAVIPVYLYTAHYVQHTFAAAGRSLLYQLLYAVCVAACLIPTPLLEFRYYIVPFIIFSLHQQHQLSDGGSSTSAGGGTTLVGVRTAVGASVLHIVYYAVLNAVTIYVFLYRSFRWPDQSIARFMW